MAAETRITVTGGEMSEREQQHYRALLEEKYPGRRIESIEIEIESDESVKIRSSLATTPFERIRRITGYLVGTLDRFNNAKRAEESRRVKHAVGTE